MLDVIGYIGSFAFAICGIPLALEVLKAKHARNINTWFLVLWVIGEIFTLTYVLLSSNWPLVPNYIFNLITLLIVLKYKILPGELYDK